jgi:hypothetical protein
MSALAQARAVLWVTVLAGVAGTSWGQSFVHKAGEALPSRLKTVLGPASRTVEIHNSYIGCYDVRNGNPTDCRFVMNINGLATVGNPLENHGGHGHVAGRPLGELRFGGATGSQLNGQTGNTQVVVEHLLPQVGGVIERRLDLFVPPGWRTVDPQSCDATQTFWCFLHRLNVKVPALSPLTASNCLPALPPAPICKLRASPDNNHTDAAAFYGTTNALLFLNAMADEFRQRTEGLPLAVNDMSLVSGGFFDLDLGWQGEQRHSTHRTGDSADISKRLPGMGDCTTNLTLRAVVDELMPVDPRSAIQTRTNRAGVSRFLCEAAPTNNIHIDFDQIPPIIILGPF